MKVGQRHQEKLCLEKNETADRAEAVICQNPFDFGVVKAAKGGQLVFPVPMFSTMSS